jgi:serine-type D-Ala-D-Ala carboxypeptidase/endopeptidase (penicillin-binding protein 4)
MMVANRMATTHFGVQIMQVVRNILLFTVPLCVIFSSWIHSYAAEPLSPEGLSETLDTLIDGHPTAERTTVTLKVVDLETGEVLYDRGGDKLLVPASNLKIYTASAALDLLGPTYRWQTQVVVPKPLRSGVCDGDLVLRGPGDPMMDTEQLAHYAFMLDQQGLKTVRGQVRVETAPRWESVPLKGPGWMWDDDPDYYNMSIRTMMLNFNTVKVAVSHGREHAQVTLDPPSDYPVVVVLAEPGSDSSSVRITRAPFDDAIYVYGNPGPDADPVSETITVHDPSPWIASVFKQMLEDRGVSFTNKRKSSAARDEVVMLNGQGKTLAEALKHFLKVSENAVGEMILLKLAEAQTEEDVAWPVGAKVISDWLVNTAGLEEGSFRLVDGSGLSRYNMISADSSVKLLAFMKTHEHFEPFFDGLPVYKVELPTSAPGGGDGSEKWGGVPLAEFETERVFAKTGGMAGVSTISGYIKTLDGRWLAFSLLGNGYLGSNKPVKELRNMVWAELVRYRVAEAEALKPVSP